MKHFSGTVIAVVLACLTVLPLAGAFARGSDCAPDGEIASALDNYQVAWAASMGRLGAKPGSEVAPSLLGTPWKRVTDEAHDGVDSLRSGAVGDNEHVELTARIAGPARIQFQWKVDSQERGDFLTFSVVSDDARGASDGSLEQAIPAWRISGEQEWTRVEVPLPEATVYRVRWSYVKDGHGSAGADAGWIDGVRIEGAGYGEIEMYPTEIGDDFVNLSWPTVPCRHYLVEWRPKETSLAWRPTGSEVKPAEGTVGRVLERLERYEEREYRVTLIEPPSFTRTPPSQEVARAEGAPLALEYEAEGSGELKYAWYFRGVGVEQPARLPDAGEGRQIVSSDGRTSLRIDTLTEANEGEYILVVANEAGRERAPPVFVAVFQSPRLRSLVVRKGEEPEYRIALDDVGTSPIPELSLNAGDTLELEAEVSGSATIEAIWERKAPDSGEWQPWHEGDGTRLRIVQVTGDHAGHYRLELENRWGTWEGPRVLVVSVNTSPRILCVRAVPGECLPQSAGKTSIDVDQFDPLALTVEVEGSELTYRWFHEGRVVPEQAGGKTPEVAVSTDRAGVLEYAVHVTNATNMFDRRVLTISVVPAKDGTVFRDCDDCPEMVVIPRGSLTIDSSTFDKFDKSVARFLRDHCKKQIGNAVIPIEEESDSAPAWIVESWSWNCRGDFPNHSVPRSLFASGLELGSRIAVGKYEITRSEFARFVGATNHGTGRPCWTYTVAGHRPSLDRVWQSPGFEQGGRHPAVCVSWADAEAYVNWLRDTTGKPYRLLSEAEWEYVARAGTKGSRYWDNDDRKDRFYISRYQMTRTLADVGVEWNYADETDLPCAHANGSGPDSLRAYQGYSTLACEDGATYTAQVGSYSRNAFGLHDMLGNVEEWVVGACEKGMEIEPPTRRHPFIHRNPPDYLYAGECWRISRGQSWLSGRFHVSAREQGKVAGYRASFVGFRVARDLAP